MTQFKTHYDNLKVSRTAPDNVIKAAYKSLCQTYHPDKFQGNKEDADKTFKIILQSYAVLSDPAKRAQHDAWIEKKTKEAAKIPTTGKTSSSPAYHKQSALSFPSTVLPKQYKPLRFLPKRWGLRSASAVILGVLLIASVENSNSHLNLAHNASLFSWLLNTPSAINSLLDKLFNRSSVAAPKAGNLQLATKASKEAIHKHEVHKNSTRSNNDAANKLKKPIPSNFAFNPQAFHTEEAENQLAKQNYPVDSAECDIKLILTEEHIVKCK